MILLSDFFKDYNPWVQFIYFISVLSFTMFIRHPVVQVFSFLGSISYIIIQNGLYNSYKIISVSIITGILIAIINPLLVHQGVTILGYFSNGNPLTLESIIFGVSAGVMFTSVMIWFSCHNKIMTSDKILYISGVLFPSLSLIFSMVLRFVPLYIERIKTINACRKGIGDDITEGNIFRRFKNALKVFSIFITWSLESSIETADSMKARGHGLKGRTHFAIFKFERRDILSIIFLVLSLIILIYGVYLRKFKMVIYPVIKIAKITPFSYAIFIIFGVMTFLPVIVSIVEEFRWKYLR